MGFTAISKMLHRHLFFISEYSVYSLLKITIWLSWRYLQKSAMKIKSHSITQKEIAPLFRIVFFMLVCMTEAHGQPKNSGSSIFAQHRLNITKGQLEQIMVWNANKNRDMMRAWGAFLLIIGFLLFKISRNTLRYKCSLQAQQRELDQKNKFIERLSSDQERLLKEKEWLIKEVQHRVKNILQMVTSLLYSQSVYLEDGAAIQAIKDSLRRIQAMSIIHQRLYQDKLTTTISMPEYIRDLVQYLHGSFDTSNLIVFEQSIELAELDISQVLPLGLILTEGIVNAIKYAFFNRQHGIVRISLRHDGPEHLLLKISDNGIGLPVGLDITALHSLGLDLIQGLSKQLKGNFQIENDSGVHITVRFAIVNITSREH